MKTITTKLFEANELIGKKAKDTAITDIHHKVVLQLIKEDHEYAFEDISMLAEAFTISWDLNGGYSKAELKYSQDYKAERATEEYIEENLRKIMGLDMSDAYMKESYGELWYDVRRLLEAEADDDTCDDYLCEMRDALSETIYGLYKDAIENVNDHYHTVDLVSLAMDLELWFTEDGKLHQ
jgi:hypothetical protein